MHAEPDSPQGSYLVQTHFRDDTADTSSPQSYVQIDTSNGAKGTSHSLRLGYDATSAMGYLAPYALPMQTFQLPLYLRSYGVAHQWIGPLTNERSFAGALVLPVVGRISDRTTMRLGRRRPFFLVGVPAIYKESCPQLRPFCCHKAKR